MIESLPETVAARANAALWAEYRGENPPDVHDRLRDQLIEQYAPIVRGIVSRLPVHLPNHMDQDDMTGYGTIGMVQAIDQFDPDMGFKFETFARKRIRGAALDAVRAQTPISRTAHEQIRTILATYVRLEDEQNRPAEDKEVANELGVTIKDLNQSAQLAAWEMLSLDQPLRLSNYGIGENLGETIDSEDAGPEDETIKRLDLEELSSAMEHLPERERILIGLYYVEDMTISQIAEVFHVTKPRIRQIHNRALLRLRRIMEPEEERTA